MGLTCHVVGVCCAGAVPRAHHAHPWQPREPADHAGASWHDGLCLRLHALVQPQPGSRQLRRPPFILASAAALPLLHLLPAPLPPLPCCRCSCSCGASAAVAAACAVAITVAVTTQHTYDLGGSSHLSRCTAFTTSACASMAASTCGATAPTSLTTSPCPRS